jgi:hypothetical protein
MESLWLPQIDYHLDPRSDWKSFSPRYDRSTLAPLSEHKDASFAPNTQVSLSFANLGFGGSIQFLGSGCEQKFFKSLEVNGPQSEGVKHV